MSMVINLVEDHNIYLCEGGPVYNGGVQPSPITYLTQWKIVGNSEVHGNEIWSCGEYNPIDGKWHILVQPQGGSIADIALTEPLRKVNNVADTIEFPSDTEGKALVTRNIAELSVAGNVLSYRITNREDECRWNLGGSAKGTNYQTIGNIICSNYNSITSLQTYARNTGIGIEQNGVIVLFDKTYNQQTDKEALEAANANTKYIFELATPTTELVDAPQIAEADSYYCVISQGAKAVSWSEFNGGILEFYDKIIPTNNAYIDTGYIPTVDSKFVVHIKRAMLDNCCIYSNAVQGKTDGIRFLLAGKNFYVSFGAPRKMNSGLSELELNIVHEHTQYVTINGNSDTYITSVDNMYINEPLTIFSDYYNRSTSGAMAYFNGNSLYSFKIYENDVLVRDFKPCTYKGVAGLWDIVESKFYGNSNNVGTLTASNDA